VYATTRRIGCSHAAGHRRCEHTARSDGQVLYLPSAVHRRVDHARRPAPDLAQPRTQIAPLQGCLCSSRRTDGALSRYGADVRRSQTGSAARPWTALADALHVPGSISTGIGHLGGLGPLGHLSAVASKGQTWTFGTLYLELLQRYADFFLPRSARAEAASATPAPTAPGASAGRAPGSPPLPTRGVAAVATTPSRTPGPGGLLGSVLEAIQHGHPPHTPAPSRPGFGLSTPLAARSQAASGATAAPSGGATTVLTSPYVAGVAKGARKAATTMILTWHWSPGRCGGASQRCRRGEPAHRARRPVQRLFRPVRRRVLAEPEPLPGQPAGLSPDLTLCMAASVAVLCGARASALTGAGTAAVAIRSQTYRAPSPEMVKCVSAIVRRLPLEAGVRNVADEAAAAIFRIHEYAALERSTLAYHPAHANGRCFAACAPARGTATRTARSGRGCTGSFCSPLWTGATTHPLDRCVACAFWVRSPSGAVRLMRHRHRRAGYVPIARRWTCGWPTSSRGSTRAAARASTTHRPGTCSRPQSSSKRHDGRRGAYARAPCTPPSRGQALVRD